MQFKKVYVWERFGVVGICHAQLGKEFPRCRAVALYISMKKPSLPSKLEQGLFT